MSTRVSLLGMLRLIRVDTLRTVGFLEGRINYFKVKKVIVDIRETSIYQRITALVEEDPPQVREVVSPIPGYFRMYNIKLDL